MDLHARLAEYFVKGLACEDVESEVMKGFAADGTDTAVHNRQILYALGYATFRNFPGNLHFGDTKLWDAAMQMVDAICERQAVDGTWRWRVPLTGRVYDFKHVWSVYAWLRTIDDFGEHFAVGRLQRFREVIARTMTARFKSWQRYQMTGERRTSLNIFVWEGLELWLGGRLLGNSEWEKAGKLQVDSCLHRQKPDGWWPDAQQSRGPVVSYNGVTLSAASAYARLSGEDFARESVRRAAPFHLDFCYPDGSLVETIDERNRYGRQKPGQQSCAGKMRLACAFAPFEETRHAAAFFAAAESAAETAAAAALMNMDISRVADVLDAVIPGKVEVHKHGEGAAIYDIPALVRRRKPWVCSLSGSTTQVRGGQCHLDLQNHISIWHQEHGLIVGGGHSLWDASFSTVRLGGRYLATGAQVRAEAERDMLSLHFDGMIVHIAMRILDVKSIRFEVRTEGTVPLDSEFALILPNSHGREFEQWGAISQLGEQTVFMDWSFEPSRLLRCRIGALTIESDTVGIVTWPHHPISIYNVPSRLPLEDAVMRVAIPISSELRQMTLRLI